MTDRIDYAIVYIALNHLDMMPTSRIANYSDYAALPADVKGLCHGNNGYAGMDAMKAYLAAR